MQRIIRQTFYEAVGHQEYTYNPAHAGHCFDALRQVGQLCVFAKYVVTNLSVAKVYCLQCRQYSSLHIWRQHHRGRSNPQMSEMGRPQRLGVEEQRVLPRFCERDPTT